MRHIFISKLPQLLTSWSEAFPQSYISFTLPDIDSAGENEQMDAETIFWLHMNEDRQQWMEKMIESILGAYKNAKIVILANTPNHTESLYALRLGARGYCHAYSQASVLSEIKTVIANGGIWIGQEFLQKLIEVSIQLVENQPEYIQSLLAKLTKREKEVAIEAAKGLSNKEIARVLSITERTVKAHLAATFERLGAKDRLQLALMLNNNIKI